MHIIGIPEYKLNPGFPSLPIILHNQISGETFAEIYRINFDSLIVKLARPSTPLIGAHNLKTGLQIKSKVPIPTWVYPTILKRTLKILCDSPFNLSHEHCQDIVKIDDRVTNGTSNSLSYLNSKSIVRFAVGFNRFKMCQNSYPC